MQRMPTQSLRVLCGGQRMWLVFVEEAEADAGACTEDIWTTHRYIAPSNSKQLQIQMEEVVTLSRPDG
jgi:hypothetical protein